MKSIYCNCGSYLGEHEEFNVIRCKNCGIDYVVNPKDVEGFWDYYKTNKVAIHTSTREDYENLTKAICCQTGDTDEEVFYKYEGNTCIRLDEMKIGGYSWLYGSKSFYEKEGYKIIPYQSIKNLIEKELDK